MPGVFDRFKEFIGFGDLDEDDDFYEYESEAVAEEESEPSVDTSYDDMRLDRVDDKVINLRTSRQASSSTKNVKVMIYEPEAYDEVTTMIDELRAGKIIVINMLGLEHELKSNVFHCLSGSVYSLDGSMQKVAKDIFVMAPSNVQVDSKKLSEEISNRGIFRWQKQ